MYASNIYIDCIIFGLIDWLIGWLIDWLVDWLIDWLIDRLIGWLIDWLIDRLIDWMIDRLNDWLIDWLNGLDACSLFIFLSTNLAHYRISLLLYVTIVLILTVKRFTTLKSFVLSLVLNSDDAFYCNPFFHMRAVCSLEFGAKLFFF